MSAIIHIPHYSSSPRSRRRRTVDSKIVQFGCIWVLFANALTDANAFDQSSVDLLTMKKTCQNCDLSGAMLADVYLPGAILTDANLKGAHLKGANLGFANFNGAKLVEADLSGVVLTNANFSKADLSNANMSNASLHGADMTGAVLIGTNLRDAHLEYVKFKGADLNKTDLTGAMNLDAKQLAEAKLCDTTMPDGHKDNSGC